MHRFKREFGGLNEAFQARFGQPLTLTLRAEDQHLYSGLRLPLNDEWPEFDSQLAALAKVLPESLNVALLEAQSGKQVGDEGVAGSLDLLEVALVTLGSSPRRPSA